MTDASDGGRLYRALFDQLDEAVCFIERLPVRSDGQRDYRYLAVNPATQAMFGVSDLRGQSIRNNFPDEAESWYDDYDRVLETGEPIRFERRSDPQGMVIDMLVSRVDGPAGDALMIVMRDVTAWRSLSEELERRVEERTAERDRMWATSPDLLAEASLEGVYQRANPAWRAILGYSSDDVVGRTAADFVHPDDMQRMLGALATAQAERLPSVNLRFRAKDGGYRWIQWVAAPSEGLIFALGRDVTAAVEAEEQLRLTEEALRQSQKMEAVGQLTGGVAHDFNNLLTIIRSSVDFLRRPDLPEERRQRYLDAASDTVDRAAKLTGQLLAFARRQPLRPETFDLVERVRAVLDMLDAVIGPRILLVAELPAQPCHVRADVSQFETALVNMAVNARDAMDGAGTLTVTVVCDGTLPAIRHHAASSAPFAAIRVADTGSGIAAGQLAHIFEPFYTTKEVGKGTGLGLSQVFGFAKQSGGDIDVASAAGQGALFTLYLPQVAAEAIAPKPAAGADADASSGAGQCILVVEDNVEIGQFCTQVLHDLGYRTALATSAEQALEMLGADGHGFDAVFSDVVMPGIGGFALAQTLRQKLPALPIVLASGYSHVLALEGDHGFELLRKPYSADQLGDVLKRVVPAEPR